MIKQIFNYRIPSLIGILLLLLGVGVTSFIVDQGIILEGRAAPEKTPANIVITNVTPNSFTVLYTTQDEVNGSVTYGTDANGTGVALDDRDQQAGHPSPARMHHISVYNLKPDTEYYFSILSGDTVYKNGEEPYKIKTAPVLPDQPTEYNPINGSLLLTDSVQGDDVTVLLNSDGTQPVSARVNPDGSYYLPLAALRTDDLSAYAALSDASVLNIKVLSPDMSSDVRVLLPNTDPVPLITFGQDYDFTINPLSVGSLNDNQASDSAGTSFPETAGNESAAGTITILAPDENETFTDQQPLFTGTALPGEEIELTIHSEGPVKATIQAGADGSWSFRPETALPPGNHTLTIRTRDVTGTLREFTRSFTVYAQGSQFIEPSVSPTRTPTPTFIDFTPTPTVIAPTVTLQPTATPTPAVPVSPSPTRPPLDATGSTEIAIGGILGVGTVIVGVILFLFTRGSLL